MEDWSRHSVIPSRIRSDASRKSLLFVFVCLRQITPHNFDLVCGTLGALHWNNWNALMPLAQIGLSFERIAALDSVAVEALWLERHFETRGTLGLVPRGALKQGMALRRG